MSTTVHQLRDVRMGDAADVGGKAAGIGELFAAGARVPDGVVLATGLANLSPDERRALLGTAAERLGAGPFAVRSSGVAEDGADRSFAGMFETVLNVPAEALPAAADRVLASAEATRAAAYGGGDGARLAVIVQRMVSPAAAGVALTADPISGDRESVVITAVRGLGERLVSGAAIGDEWVVRNGKAVARRESGEGDRPRHGPRRWPTKPAASRSPVACRRISNGRSTRTGPCGSSRPGR